MQLKVFAIRDEKLGAYLTPFYNPARGAAIRAITDEISNPQSPVSKHPADYVLFELGTYDDLTAKFELYESPLALNCLADFVK